MADETPSKRTLSALTRYTTVSRQVFDGQDLISLRALHLWFERCSFVAADLRHATLDGCSFKLCDLRGAVLRGASLRGVSWAGCDLRDADLRDTDLAGARFGFVNTGAPPYGLTDVTGAQFDNAIVRGLETERVIGWDR
ncbi:pentapeptide repeat-containing protein [Actinomadura gamaensis]|uniref:Pentapeptide repeat-containing protein n=1 Tax=Actinomadura gamaensis TaxID=1763541 RepID=A0ABV9TXN8_9ACTN